MARLDFSKIRGNQELLDGVAAQSRGWTVTGGRGAASRIRDRGRKYGDPYVVAQPTYGRTMTREDRRGDPYWEAQHNNRLLEEVDRKAGERTTSRRITVNGRTFSSAAEASAYASKSVKERTKYRDAVASLMDRNAPNYQKNMDRLNAWFNSGKDVTDKDRTNLSNLLQGRFASLREQMSGLPQGGTYAEFKKEQEKLAGSPQTGPYDSGTPGGSGAKAGKDSTGRYGIGDWASRHNERGQYVGRTKEVVEASRRRDAEAHQKYLYTSSGKGAEDRALARLRDMQSRHNASTYNKLADDYANLLRLSQSYGIQLTGQQQQQQASSGMPQQQQQQSQAPDPATTPETANQQASAGEVPLSAPATAEPPPIEDTVEQRRKRQAAGPGGGM